MNLRMPEVRYARSGDVSIAYQCVGDGPIDIVFVPFLINLVWAWEQRLFVDFCRRLAAFSRLIMLDKRGTGLSDRPSDFQTLEARMDDIRAVMDAARSERAALLGAAAGGQLCALFAATYPERVVALALHDTLPCVVSKPGYEAGEPAEVWERRLEKARSGWGTPAYHRADLREYFALQAGDRVFEHWYVNHERLAASPGAAVSFLRVLIETDIRDILPAIRVPTLVMYHAALRAGCLALAERVPDATTVEMHGSALSIYADLSAAAEVEGFVGRGRAAPVPERVLTTLLFIDIVDSTSRAAELGDARWRELLEAYQAAIREQLARFGGVEIASAGDGFLATFDGPARAIRCAEAALAAASELELELRAGVHTGEVERVGDTIGGIAVHTGARIAAEARPGEVLVSSTVKDLVAGSGIEFEERGVHVLRGVPGEWRLFAVA